MRFFLFLLLIFLIQNCLADIDSSDIENLVTTGLIIDTSLNSLNKTIYLSKKSFINFVNNTIIPYLDQANSSIHFFQNEYSTLKPTINNFDQFLSFVQNTYNDQEQTIEFTIQNLNNFISFIHDQESVIKHINDTITFTKSQYNDLKQYLTLKYITLISLTFFGTAAITVMSIITIFVIIINKINNYYTPTQNLYTPLENF